MARISLEQLRSTLDGSISKLKEFLTVYDKAISEIKKDSDTIKKNLAGLGKNSSQGISNINKALERTEKLAQQRQKTDVARIKTLTELEKVQERRKKLLTENGKALEKERLELQKTKKEVRDNIKANSALTNAYQKLTIKTRDAQNQFKKLAAELGVNSKEARRAQREFERLDNKLSKINKVARDGRRDVGQYEKAWGGVGSQFMRITSAFGIVNGLQLLSTGIKDAVNIVREFEVENARLAGILNTNVEGVKALTDEAERLGSTTAKTARDVLALQQAYARLGFTQQEIIELTEPTINGSLALNASLEDTAELTGAVVNSFNEFTAVDAPKILDVLTSSTQKSALNFERLSTAIPIAAGAASAARVPFTTFIAQLGKAADRGIDASSAATSLRNIYIELADQGLELEEALELINKSQDKLSKATELFGKRAATTALALADTVDETREFDDALKDADGTAEEFANLTLDTLDGKLKLLSSAWEGFILSLNEGESAFGSLAKTSVEFFTRTIQFASNLSAQFKLIRGDLSDLTNKEFKALVNIGELDSGVTIIDFLDNAGLSIDKFRKTISKLPSFEESGLIYTREQVDLLNTVEAELSKSLQTIGESRKDAEEFARRYTELLETQLSVTEETTKAQDTLNTAVAGGEEEAADKIKTRAELLEDLAEAQKELKREFEQGGDDPLQTRPEEIKRLEKRIELLRELLFISEEVVKTKNEEFEVDTSNTDDFFKDLEEKNKALEKAEEDRKKQREDSINDIREASQTAIDIFANYIDSIFDAQSSRIESEIEASQQQFNKILAAFENGSQTAGLSLAAEQKRQEDLQREQQELEQKRIRTEALIAGLNAYAASGNVGEALTAIAAIGAAANDVSSFMDGTEDTGTNGKGVDGKGGFRAILHPNEGVITKEINMKKLNAGLTNESAVDYAIKYKELMRMGQLSSMGVSDSGMLVSIDNSEVVDRLKSLEDTIKQLPKQMPSTSSGFTPDGKYTQNVIKRDKLIEKTRQRANTGWASNTWGTK